MKSIKILAVCLAAVLGLSSCASSWLDQELTGSTLTQEEYNSMNNVAVGTVKGIYAQLYTYGNCGSTHDAFGQKTIDIVSDLTSSDMAMCAEAYGWFVTDAHRQLSSRTGSYWTYFYGIIMNANAVLRSLDKKSSMSIPEQQAYAQALSLRAYAYYSIANLYGPADLNHQSQYGLNGVGTEYDLAPIYTQNDTTKAGLVKEQPLSTFLEVRMFVRKDLAQAIEMFDETGYARDSKLFIDGNVARGLQAYNYLQMAWLMPDEGGELTKAACYQQAFNHAVEVIESGEYRILPYENVLTTGFVDVNEKSWMWGLNVTPENRTSLASFWGHMDIHTYSYAFAGAYKGCDETLYQAIDAHDKRKQWFNHTRNYNIPDWKFYDLGRGTTADDIDRDWLNDVVYMRIEEMYLIAAEAALRNNDKTNAQKYLMDILDERFDETVDLNTYYDGDLLKQIYMNWRIELWGEGRSLITWKRFGLDGADYANKRRGSNHYSQSGTEVKTSEWNYVTYIMPSSEAAYNNEIAD